MGTLDNIGLIAVGLRCGGICGLGGGGILGGGAGGHGGKFKL